MQQTEQQDKGVRSWTRILLFFGVSLLFFVMADRAMAARQVQLGIADKVIRFHVLADSDSKEDQELKLKVRDTVGLMMKERLEGAQNLDQSRQIIQDSLGDIENCARAVILREGYTYGVEASLTDSSFPVKTYGRAFFPAGEYEALRVVIGSGKGHNWWCVMYPNLCFAGSMYEVDEDRSRQQLREVLSPEEYETVMEGEGYQVRFRFLTFLDKIFSGGSR